MRWRAALVVVAMLALALLTGAASAQDRAELLRRCDGTEKVEPAARIAACSALIDSANESAQDRAVALFYRGLAQERAGDQDKALADQNEAIRLDPMLPGPYLVRGRYHAERRDYDSAIKDFGEVIRLNSSSKLAFTRRGDAYHEKGSFEAALRDFEEAIRIDPNYAAAYGGRRRAYEGLGQYETAQRTDPNTWAYGCAYLVVDRKFDEAMAACNGALAIAPDFPEALRWRAMMLLEGGRRDAALADLDRAIRVEPTSASGRELRGLAHLGAGNLDAAIADLDEALRREPHRSSALYARGLARQRNGDPAGGAADLAAVKEDHAKLALYLAEFGIR